MTDPKHHSEPAREAVDTRPADCRFRLVDEGKAYPKSSCRACGKGIATGLGRHCTVSASPAPASGVEAVREATEQVRYHWEVIQGQCSEGDGFTERAATDLELAIVSLEAALAAPAATGGEAVQIYRWRFVDTGAEWSDWFLGSLPDDDIETETRTLYTHPAPSTGASGTFKIGDRVRKTKGSRWQGRIVGTYSTSLTPEGYCVESETEVGSVQIYPAAALEVRSDG